MTPGQRLADAMHFSGIKGAAIGRHLGFTRQWVDSLKKGRHDAGDHWPAIAKLLGVPLEWLINGTGTPPSWEATPTATQNDDTGDFHLPIIGAAAAATGNRVEGHEEEGRLPIKGTWQAVVIRGSSGEPVVLPGQTVLVDPRLKAAKNRLVEREAWRTNQAVAMVDRLVLVR